MYIEQHYLFVLWMKANKSSKWELFKKLEPTIVKMSWQTNDNSTDCAIFVMRHMESYMGQPWTRWETGLDKESVSNEYVHENQDNICMIM